MWNAEIPSKEMFYERKLPLQVALDSVLYNIQSMLHGVTEDTPFFLFFGHHMHTKPSALQPCPQATTGPR